MRAADRYRLLARCSCASMATWSSASRSAINRQVSVPNRSPGRSWLLLWIESTALLHPGRFTMEVVFRRCEKCGQADHRQRWLVRLRSVWGRPARGVELLMVGSCRRPTADRSSAAVRPGRPWEDPPLRASGWLHLPTCGPAARQPRSRAPGRGKPPAEAVYVVSTTSSFLVTRFSDPSIVPGWMCVQSDLPGVAASDSVDQASSPGVPEWPPNSFIFLHHIAILPTQASIHQHKISSTSDAQMASHKEQ